MLPHIRLLPDRASYEPMTALDAAFLDAETDRTPLHIGSLSILEGAPFFDERGAFRLEEVHRRVAERLHLFPRFRKRVASTAFGQGRPVWVDDTSFDISRHVKLMVLPHPGSREELAELCSYLQMRRLDRAHPLWELWFIGGLDDGNVALIEKVHHAMVDGVSGVDVAAALLDIEPDVEREPGPSWSPVPPPGPLPLAVHAGREVVLAPLRWTRAFVGELTSSDRARDKIDGLVDAVTSLTWRERPVRSSLNRSVGADRRLAWVTTPLRPLRAAAHGREATVNDVVLSAVTAGLRALLLDRGDALHGLELHALVPVSTRTEDEHGSLGNRVSAILAPLPVHLPTADARVAVIREAMRRHKAHHEADATELVLDTIAVVPPGLLALAAHAIHHQPLVNVVVTNVPGPPFPLYFLGARMLESVPIVPLGGNLTLGIAILSYDDKLTIGAYADRSRCRDLDVFLRGLRTELAELTPTASTAAAALGPSTL